MAITQYVDIINGSDTFQTITPTAITRANPCVVTSAGHGLANGQWIHFASVGGMAQLNTNTYKIANVAANTFSLQDLDGNDINSSAFTAYTSGGTITIWRKMVITGISKAAPGVVTAPKHGFSDGNIVIIEDVAGMTEVNNVAFTVAGATTDTFTIVDTSGVGYTAYTSGGTVTRPFLLMNTLEGWRAAVTSPRNRFYMNGDTVEFAKTFTYGAGITVGSGNILFTRNSVTVTTSVDLRASLSVGHYIGLTTATLNGWDTSGSPTRPDIFYKIIAITASTITLNVRYASTTTTVSSVYRLRPGTEIPLTGAASAHCMSTAGTSITYEGGYSFNTAGAITRDGSTTWKPVSAGDWYNWTTTDTSSTWRYFGFLDGNRGWITGAGCNNSIVEYCSANALQYYAYHIASTAGGIIIRNCWVTNYVSSSNEGIFISAGANCMASYCYGVNNATAARPFTSSIGGSIQFEYCKVECSLLGFAVTSTANPIIKNCEAVLCSGTGGGGGFTGNSSTKFDTCTADTCSTGFFLTGTNNSFYLKGCIATGNTVSAVSCGAVFGVRMEDCTFTSNVLDVLTDQYTNGIVLINCSSTTPTNWHISRVLNTAPIICNECTIDAPSVAKAIQIVTGSNYDSPQFLLQNSYGKDSGAYYANGQYTEDAATFRTSGASMKLQYSSTISGNTVPLKIFSYYVAGGTAKTFTYYVKRDAGAWSGTIVPQIRLNGKLIKTETTISSLTTSWVAYTASATSGQITGDGELSLEFVYNANNIAIWIDDVTIA